MSAALPRVAIVTTGGTIDSLGVDRLDLAAYLETGVRLAPGELVAGIAPELAMVARATEVPFRRLRAHALTDGDLADLVDLVRGLLDRDEADGVVVTHGTNTLEETAWLLHLVVGDERPVVVTGAMRPASALSGDGPLNVVNAVRLAASPAARGLGTLVLLDDTIHGARDVTKTDTMRVSAFRDGAGGPLGWVDGDGRVVLNHRPVRGDALRGRFAATDLRDLPRVDVVVTYLGADGALVDAAVAVGARGIVSAGSGRGLPDAGRGRGARAGRRDGRRRLPGDPGRRRSGPAGRVAHGTRLGRRGRPPAVEGPDPPPARARDGPRRRGVDPAPVRRLTRAVRTRTPPGSRGGSRTTA